MKPENFIKALKIISESHSAKVIINNVEENQTVRDDLKNDASLHIIDCTARVVLKLMENGFSLSMQEGKLSVQDYNLL